MKRKRGEVREDGRIFKGYQRTPAGTLVEQWLSPEAWENMRARQAVWVKQDMAKKRQNAEWLAAFNEKAAARIRADRRANPVAHMLTRARVRAKERGVPFDITKDDVVLPTKCPVFGKKLSIGDGAPHAWSPELDRIVPSKGYVKGNVIVVSRKANRIKTDATPEDVQKVASFYAALKARRRA